MIRNRQIAINKEAKLFKDIEDQPKYGQYIYVKPTVINLGNLAQVEDNGYTELNAEGKNENKMINIFKSCIIN